MKLQPLSKTVPTRPSGVVRPIVTISAMLCITATSTVSGEELDGLSKLAEAQAKVAKTHVDILNALAEMRLKDAQAHLTFQQGEKERIENIERYLRIIWKAQAEHDLERILKIARQEAKKARDEADSEKTMARNLGVLLSGGALSWPTFQGWRAFNHFRDRADKAWKIDNLPLPAEAFEPSTWYSSKPLTALPQSDHDFGHLAAWATHNKCVPKLNTAAWDALAEYLKVLDKTAAKHAADLERDAEKAAADARVLSEKYWEQLKQVPTKEGQKS